MRNVLFLILLFPYGVTYAGLGMDTHPIRICEGTRMIPLTRWDMSIDLNFFPEASPERPHYIRLDVTDIGTTLMDTFVDLGEEPIYLALRLNDSTTSDGGELKIIAPPDALSLVRWRQGEDEIWLKVQAPTTSWISVDGTATPLDDDLPPVYWSLGVTGEVSESDNGPLMTEGRANRTSNSRGNLAPTSTQGSGLLGPSSYFCVFVSFLDDETSGVEEAEALLDIQLGERIFIPFNSLDYCSNHRDHSCGTLAYPWISYNDIFDSRVVITNAGPEKTNAALTATRGDGVEYFSFLSIPANGFIAKRPAELFPELEPGPGFSVKVMATAEHVYGRWVTYGKTTAGGQSPSQGTAISIADTSNEVGETILLGYLPQSQGFISAPVIVNLGEGPVDVTLYFYDQHGEKLKVDRDTIKGLQPNRPFALTTSELLADTAADIADDVAVVAHAPGAKLAGVGFVFNENREPAIGNGQVIPLRPTSFDKNHLIPRR